MELTLKQSTIIPIYKIHLSYRYGSEKIYKIYHIYVIKKIL